MTTPGFAHINADWPAPANIVALTTCRGPGGQSLPPYECFNLALHVGDNADIVNQHRYRLLSDCERLQSIQWLSQIHSDRVVEAGFEPRPKADACFTRETGVACAVMTADCLPLLICDVLGEQVAAVHAGWRGLANGIIENTLARFNVPADQLMVWLGPAISALHYQVGSDLREVFLAKSRPEDFDQTAGAFTVDKKNKNHYYADLYQLARIRLAAKSVTAVYGGQYCSYRDDKSFYSYRRQPVTGRMATLIYRKS